MWCMYVRTYVCLYLCVCVCVYVCISWHNMCIQMIIASQVLADCCGFGLVEPLRKALGRESELFVVSGLWLFQLQEFLGIFSSRCIDGLLGGFACQHCWYCWFWLPDTQHLWHEVRVAWIQWSVRGCHSLLTYGHRSKSLLKKAWILSQMTWHIVLSRFQDGGFKAAFPERFGLDINFAADLNFLRSMLGVVLGIFLTTYLILFNYLLRDPSCDGKVRGNLTDHCKPEKTLCDLLPSSTMVLFSCSFGHPICPGFAVLTCQKLQISGWEWLTILSSFPCGRFLRSLVTWIRHDETAGLHCQQAEHCFFSGNGMELLPIGLLHWLELAALW